MSDDKSEVSCHDCGCKEGELHEYGCDMERCPFCGNQLLSCDCCYKYLGFKMNESLPFCGLPEEIYNNGLSRKQHEKWIQILEEKGRVPYIVFPIICARCGVLYPDLFMVADEEWEKYIPIRQRDKVLCRDCYEEIKSLIYKKQIARVRK